MLPTSQRLTSPQEFREVVRRGRRCGGSLLVVHLLTPTADPAADPSADPASAGRADTPLRAGRQRAGFVVSKAVGPAVTRTLVKRRLRHLVRDRLPTLPDGSLLVVRAQPAAATAAYEALAGELDRCLAAATSPRVHRSGRSTARPERSESAAAPARDAQRRENQPHGGSR